MASVGKWLFVAGLALAALGGVLWLAGPRIDGSRGFLPGDIVIRRPGFTFQFPIVTCMAVSVILTLLARLFRR